MTLSLNLWYKIYRAAYKSSGGSNLRQFVKNDYYIDTFTYDSKVPCRNMTSMHCISSVGASRDVRPSVIYLKQYNLLILTFTLRNLLQKRTYLLILFRSIKPVGFIATSKCIGLPLLSSISICK